MHFFFISFLFLTTITTLIFHKFRKFKNVFLWSSLQAMLGIASHHNHVVTLFWKAMKIWTFYMRRAMEIFSMSLEIETGNQLCMSSLLHILYTLMSYYISLICCEKPRHCWLPKQIEKKTSRKVVNDIYIYFILTCGANGHSKVLCTCAFRFTAMDWCETNM